MASRMDRYYKTGDDLDDRSTRNKNLYKKVHNNYSENIDSIKSINRSNELDISNLKEKVNNRETYKREKELRQTMKNSNLKISISSKMDSNPVYDISELKPEKIKEKIEKIPKNYDLSDVLSKAKDGYNENDAESRNLKNLEYTDLNNLNLHNKEYKNSEAELTDLVNNLKNESNSNDQGEIGLLDSLKSDTMVGDDSIKKIIDKEIKEEKKDDTNELDKSFFTSAYDFNEEDFDGNVEKKSKGKKIMITIIIILIILISVFILYFLGIFNFKHN